MHEFFSDNKNKKSDAKLINQSILCIKRVGGYRNLVYDLLTMSLS